MDETSRKTAQQWPGAFAIFGKAFEAVKGNSKPALIVAATYAGLAFLSALISDDTTNSMSGIEDIVMILTIVPVMVYALALADGKKTEPRDFLRVSPKKLLFTIATGILLALVFILSVVAFIIPIIWTLAWFALAALPIVDKDMGPIQALKESKRISEKHKAKIWSLIGVTVLVVAALSIGQSIVLSIFGGAAAIGAFIAAGCSFLITIWLTTAEAMTYRWLQRQAK